MVELLTMEGPLSKWTNVVNGWQYRWFVLDFSVGILFYYTSKEKMKRGDRRGCVKLKNALVGIDDVDDSTFTITVDHKTFHFQARDSDDRQRWLDALQEARDLHTQDYALLHQTNRILDDPSALTEFDRRIVEADAYLQILIEQQQGLSDQAADDECRPEVLNTVSDRLHTLIELVKKTIVCLQFARESVLVGYSTVLTANPQPTSGLLADEPNPPLSDPFPTPDHDIISSESRSQFSPHVSELRQLPASCLSVTPVTSTITANVVHTKLLDDRSLPVSHPQFVSNTCMVDGVLRSPAVHDDFELGDDVADEDDNDVFFDTQEDIGQMITEYYRCDSPQRAPGRTLPSPSLPDRRASATHRLPTRNVYHQTSSNNKHAPCRSDSLSLPQLSPEDMFDDLYDDNEEEDLGSVQSQGLLIGHLLRQLRIGMDLTRITLPTFILERRSTLEMYGDFLAHADLWADIPIASNPRDRMVACMRWYLSAFHAGRRSSVAKKPYNPILGEVFRCYWALNNTSGQTTEQHYRLSHEPPDTRVHKSSEEVRSLGPVPWAPVNSVTFIAEQVSHHPPVSAFYAEHIGRGISVDGHLWTKSRFLGLSIAVEMVGSAVISLLGLDEDYIVTFPCGYGRNILTVPWIELGGKTSVTCAKTGYAANIEFKTKPFYNGKKDFMRAEVLAPNEKKPFLVIEGEWNDKMWARWSDGRHELFFDTQATPTLMKHVLPRIYQRENESRRLWEEVTANLKCGNIDAASEAKFHLEQIQRDAARHRDAAKITWVPEHFRSEGGGWIYRHPLVQRSEPAPTAPHNINAGSNSSTGLSYCSPPGVSSGSGNLSQATSQSAPNG